MSISGSKPEGGCVRCDGNTLPLNPDSGAEGAVAEPTEETFEYLTGVESPARTPAEEAVEPLDSTGAAGPVGTSTDVYLDPSFNSTGTSSFVPTPGEGGGPSGPLGESHSKTFHTGQT